MPTRYLLGIDLGTTNSVVAYIDTQDGGASPELRVFPVPQLVAHGEVRTLPTLPSFLYFPTEDELLAGTVSATWDEDPPMVTGILAREQGALVPSRQVSSAKSWLAYPGVDRHAKVLPAQAEPPQPMISPVEASARYLMHLRDAWNGALGSSPLTRFEQQEIVLTVPASFDEEARELTVEAARHGGIDHLTLLEEPLAAFYAWIAAHPDAPAGNSSGKRAAGNGEVRDGELILICDIGGGTTDFSLVRAHRAEGEMQFERTAIGEHLLLGGDNLDFALARLVEQKLKDIKLTLRQRYALRRACCAAKERLLSDSSLERAPVTILGSGRAVVGQALGSELTRDEVLQVLTSGFLPMTSADDLPARGRPTALRELGLPYAADPAITRHLAAFLRQAAARREVPEKPTAPTSLVRPDAVLFNGGFCTPALVRERIMDAVSAWFGGAETGWRPRLLNNDAVDTAVARGAAYYGRVRRGTGLRIRAGSARTYYIGLRSEQGPQGICILPAGVNEGTTLPLLNREFSVLANRPVSFTLYSSRTRHDAHGVVVPLDEDSVHRHAPLVTLLRYGKKLRDAHLSVRLRATFTEVGTLELWCESRDTPHRWRLQFELRGEEGPAQVAPAPRVAGGLSAAALPFDSSVATAVQLVRRAFMCDGEHSVLDGLVGELEGALGLKRDLWPASTIRQFCDLLIEVADGRQRSPRHEVRWLNLFGFCLRPGFGAPQDPARVAQGLRSYSNAPLFADDLQCQVERLVLLRRIAGGINASEQHALHRMLTSASGKNKKRLRVNRQLEYEERRLLASLEHLPAAIRSTLGGALLTKIEKVPADAIWLWSLGRLGARIPLYGPLHSVVAPEVAGEWLKMLLDLPTFTAATATAIILIARRTDDRVRDITDGLREQAIARLSELGSEENAIQLLSNYVPPDRGDAVRSFGESLPPGLQLVSSSSCLLSAPALHSGEPVLSQPA